MAVKDDRSIQTSVAEKNGRAAKSEIVYEQENRKGV